MIVLKWPLRPSIVDQSHALPLGAQIIHVDVDRNAAVCVWTLSEDKEPTERRSFRVLATGDVIEGTYRHVGSTSYVSDDVYFWHVFEVFR